MAYAISPRHLMRALTPAEWKVLRAAIRAIRDARQVARPEDMRHVFAGLRDAVGSDYGGCALGMAEVCARHYRQTDYPSVALYELSQAFIAAARSADWTADDGHPIGHVLRAIGERLIEQSPRYGGPQS